MHEFRWLCGKVSAFNNEALKINLCIFLLAREMISVSPCAQVVQKTAATFAPRASTATKNPAVPGTALYTVFEVQGYISMLLGGALSFNLIFPSNEPDIWRLMGMWSIWMFSKLYSLNMNYEFGLDFFCFLV